MSSFAARIYNQQQLAYVPHTSVSGDTWQCTFSGETTAAGSATSLVDLQAAGAGDNFYNGQYWIEITELGHASEGQWKRVVDYTSATGTFTLENNGFSATTGSGTEYRLWKSPEPVCVVTNVGAATTTIASARTEADDFWNGYYLVAISGTDRGKAPVLITDFANATGTFTHASGALANVAVGDVILIRKFIEPGSVSPGLSEEYLPRPSNRINFSVGDGTIGPKGGTFGFNLQIRCNGTLAADGTDPGQPEAGGLLMACGFEEVVDTTNLINDIGASGTTTSLIVDDGTQYTVGQMILWNGNAAFISTIATNTLTVTPALPSAPLDDTVIYATRGYVKSTDGDGMYGVTLEWEVDGVRTTMTGCYGNVTLQDAAALELAFAFNVDHWVREIEAAPYNAASAYSTVPPILAQDRRAYLSATATNIGPFTASLNADMQPKMIQGSIGINGRASYQIVNYNAGGTWQELLNSSSATLPMEEIWHERTSKDLIVVYGSGSQTFGVRVPAARIIESPHPADMNGQAGTPGVFAAHDAGVDANVATVKVPDFGFFFT